MINPTLMMGTVKSNQEGQVIINLRGRLGLITVSEKMIMAEERIEAGTKLEFYFSYIQTVSRPLDYDDTELIQQQELFPCLLGGKVSHVDDTAVRVNITQELGTIYVPRRWVFTSVEIVEGLDVEFYFSKMIIQKK
ncbi:CBO2463/CBO2479 domain-containing protein [Enterococcus sp. AZ072]|uniref:CBO2463/CBO2479 domain-containing protein n=1 Tax=unclassified Enterococcus TaxID=2608891 RepID=UPI003D291B0C